MVRRALLIALAALALATAVGLVLLKRRADDADRRAGIDATRVLSLAFERASALEVLHLSGTMLTRSEATGCYGLCGGVQMTRAPVRIDYTVDLEHLPRSAYRWDGKRRVMFVTLPDVRAGAPNIDLASAEVQQNGAWISRSMGQAMQHQAAVNLAQKAGAIAAKPANVMKAREAARAAVERLVAAPLAAAGVDGVTVRVRFPFDASADDRGWDASRPIDEVIADPRYGG